MPHGHSNIFGISLTTRNDPRYRLIRNAVYWSVFISSTITVLKLLAWIFTKSTSIQAAFIDSLTDTVASITALFAISIAQKPADEQHRFGHSKAESVAALVQAMFVLGSGILLIEEVLEHVFNQEQVRDTETGIWLIFVSSVLLVVLIFIQRYAIKRTKSLLVSAVAVHYKGDFFLNLGVVIAIWTSSQFNLHYIDTIFGTCVAIYIFYSAIRIFFTSTKDLMDAELPQNQKDRIIEIAKNIPAIKSVSRIQTRSAAHKKFIIMDIKIDKSVTLLDADCTVNKLIANIKAKIKNSEITVRPIPD